MEPGFTEAACSVFNLARDAPKNRFILLRK